MFVILGATGHVGGAVAGALLEANEPVLAVTHRADHADQWRERGAEAAVVDIVDTEALRAILWRGRRAFLLNPPADPATDTDAVERQTAASIAAALAGSGLDKVVVASTYGAQPGDAIGDLSVLHDFEQDVRAAGVPAAINRGAYYYTNVDALLPEARTGHISSLYPRALKVPMVSPRDLGRAAAARLRSAVDDDGVEFVEGPHRYSHEDVAAAFARALGRDVAAVEVPQEHWQAHYRNLGFSPPAARAYARMTAVSVDGGFAVPDDPIRGAVTLEAHVAELVRAADTC